MNAIALIALVLLARSDVCELASAARSRHDDLRCLACHDGVTAADGRGLVFSRMVGRDYAVASLRRRGEFRRLGAGSPVVLAGGRVACTSCHDGESALPKKLVARDVCTVCHDR
jgi:hypothetical protein